MFLLWGMHAPPLIEKVPVAQAPLQVASVVVVPGMSGDPAVHEGTVCSVHAVLSSAAEYVPEVHGVHVVSLDDDPGT